MQTIPSVVHPRIVCDPEIVGGSPRIRGTRVPVRAIACLWSATGDRDLIRRNYPHLTPEDVEAAIRFYEEHRAEIDAELLAEEQASD
jgi:type III restriction enzyme